MWPMFYHDSLTLDIVISNETKSWSDAEKYCNRWSGHLATVANKQENNQYLKEMKSRYSVALSNLYEDNV